MTDRDGPRIGVVGAGVTGLALTHHLAERGADVVTFEAADRPGGVVRSERIDGTVVEYGPQRVRLTPGVAELVGALGLRDEVVEAADDLPLYVYAGGDLRTVPRSVGAFLRTDLLSVRGKLRLLAEPLTDPIDPAETAAEAFARKLGDEAYRNVAGPLFGGTYGSDPAEMPAEHALAPLLRLEERSGSLLRAAASRLLGDGETPPAVTFEDGNQRLCEALYEAHDDKVRLNAPVEGVREVGTAGETGDGYELSVGGGSDGSSGTAGGDATDSDTVAVDEVVVTAPAGAAADVLEPVAPDAAPKLRSLSYNSVALVFLRADDDRRGLGYQVRRDEPLRTRGVTWNGPAFGRDDLYTCFLGGMTDPEVLELDDDDLGDVAATEFERVLGTEPSVLGVQRLPEVIPAYDRSWRALDDLSLPDGVRLVTNYTARLGVPARVREAKRVAGELVE